MLQSRIIRRNPPCVLIIRCFKNLSGFLRADDKRPFLTDIRIAVLVLLVFWWNRGVLDTMFRELSG